MSRVFAQKVPIRWTLQTSLGNMTTKTLPPHDKVRRCDKTTEVENRSRVSQNLFQSKKAKHERTSIYVVVET